MGVHDAATLRQRKKDLKQNHTHTHTKSSLALLSTARILHIFRICFNKIEADCFFFWFNTKQLVTNDKREAP